MTDSGDGTASRFRSCSPWPALLLALVASSPLLVADDGDHASSAAAAYQGTMQEHLSGHWSEPAGAPEGELCIAVVEINQSGHVVEIAFEDCPSDMLRESFLDAIAAASPLPMSEAVEASIIHFSVSTD